MRWEGEGKGREGKRWGGVGWVGQDTSGWDGPGMRWDSSGAYTSFQNSIFECCPGIAAPSMPARGTQRAAYDIATGALADETHSDRQHIGGRRAPRTAPAPVGGLFVCLFVCWVPAGGGRVRASAATWPSVPREPEKGDVQICCGEPAGVVIAVATVEPLRG